MKVNAPTTHTIHDQGGSIVMMKSTRGLPSRTLIVAKNTPPATANAKSKAIPNASALAMSFDTAMHKL